MPDSGLPPPYLDPSQYPDYINAQKQQMLAQMLMQNAQQANQTPQNWDQMKVVPRRGMVSNIASVADALLAGRAMKGSMNAQQKYFQNMYGGGNQPSAPSSSGVPDESTGPVAPGMAPQQMDAPPPQQNPLIPPGMGKPQAQMLMGLLGPEKYGESILAPNLKPAEIRAQIRAAGIDPDSAQGKKMALAALNKSTTNMQDVRPGGTLFDINKGQPIFSAPQNGVQTQWGPQGPQQSLVPGATQATAAMTGAETGAKTSNTPMVMPTAGGGSTIAYPSDALGAPPALRGGPQATPGAPAAPSGSTPPATTAPQVAHKGYFPSTQPPPVPKDPNDPWSTAPKLPVSKALGAPDAFTEGRLKAAGAKDAELSSQYGKESDLADQKLQYNAEAVKALPAAETGPMSEWMTENRAKLLEWGVPESMVPGSGKVTPTMELNKNLKQSALQGARAIFGSRMTQMEVRLQHEELSPSTSMTKDAIASLMQQDNIKQQYAKQRSEDYGKYVQGGGDPLRFESWYSKSFPLTKYAQQHAGAVEIPVTKTVSGKTYVKQNGKWYEQ